MRIGILTSGGDCPGINATIRGVCKTAINYYGMEVVGIHSGFQGLLTKDVESITDKSLSGLLNLGGTMLGTSREKPFKKGGVVSDVDKPSLILQNIHEIGLDCVVCIGGNGTQKTAAKFAAMGVNIVSVPKTIDNDIWGTDISFGFDSAVSIATDAIDRLHSTASSHKRVMVIEVMGHKAGWIALYSGMAGGGDVILVPEFAYNIKNIGNTILERLKKGKPYSIVVVAEGIQTDGRKRAAEYIAQEIALMSEWETKIEAIANSTIPVNVTSLSGVPSWMLVLIKRVLEKTGKQALEEVWPNLEVFFHGGVAFTPYREQYKQVIQTPKMHYVETYNASEGYFGTQNDLSDPAMLLMIDYGIFYEFVPLEEVGKESPRAYCLEEVELNKNYAMVISTSCGLWRYMIGDTVKFTSKNPYKFVITGRTKHFINAFGEELIVDNAEKGLAKACAETGAQVSEYTAAPVFMDENAKCRHQWLIEFAKMPDSVEKFAAILDATLKEVNSDYEAKRWKDIALQPLEVIVAREGLFHDWLAQRGKLGGQHKVPRLSNTREYIETMLALNDSILSEE